MSPDPLDARRRATLGVIRLALLAGVLAFGLLTWFTHRGPEWAGGPRAVAGPLPTLSLVLSVVLAIAIAFVRRAAFATRDAARYGTLTVNPLDLISLGPSWYSGATARRSERGQTTAARS
jgi:hypothetical protein